MNLLLCVNKCGESTLWVNEIDKNTIIFLSFSWQNVRKSAKKRREIEIKQFPLPNGNLYFRRITGKVSAVNILLSKRRSENKWKKKNEIETIFLVCEQKQMKTWIIMQCGGWSWFVLLLIGLNGFLFDELWLDCISFSMNRRHRHWNGLHAIAHSKWNNVHFAIGHTWKQWSN